MNQQGKLAGKVVVITAAAAGIGRASSLLFASEGATVAAIDCDEIRNVELVEEIRSQVGCAEALTADVSSAQDVERVIRDVAAHSKKIDILFNNAGLVTSGKVHTLQEEEWDRVFSVNVKSMFLFTRALYSATKSALFSLTKSMALDYAADNIRVNCLCPGTVDTPSLRARLGAKGNSEEMRKQFIARQPLRRLGTAEEIVRAALYLVSDDAGFVTGTAFQIDGGMSL